MLRNKEDQQMNANHKVAVAIIAIITIGIAGASAIHARQEKTPPSYVISEVDRILDPDALQKYGAKVGETLTPFNHKFIVARGEAQALDGGEPPKAIVVLEFDSAAKAREWYDSPAYQAIKALRINSIKGRMFIVEGVAPK